MSNNTVIADDDAWLDPDQVCDWLNVRKDWLYDMAQQNKIPHIKVGRLLRFNKGELKAWLSEHRR